MIGNVASAFAFGASEIWAMDFDEIMFWHDQIVRLGKQRNLR